MSFENTLQNQERPKISIDSMRDKLEAYPKALRAALLVGMLSVGTAHNTAEAQNEVTGGVTQSESSDAGVTIGNAEGTPAHEVDKGTVVTVRDKQVPLPDKKEPTETQTVNNNNDNIEIGETWVDGKRVTND